MLVYHRQKRGKNCKHAKLRVQQSLLLLDGVPETGRWAGYEDPSVAETGNVPNISTRQDAGMGGGLAHPGEWPTLSAFAKK